MAEEIRVEQLRSSDKTEALEVITRAFRDTPQPTFSLKPRAVRILIRIVALLMSAIQILFGKNIWVRVESYFFYKFTPPLLYGIRKDGNLVCVAVLSYPKNRAKKSPILLRIILWLIKPLFFLVFHVVFYVGRIFRWQRLVELKKLGEEMETTPKYYEARYLELIKLGTLPIYQKQGFGREMLRFIRKKAESEGYEGISLGATRDTPAFHLYIKEGFIVKYDLSISVMEGIVLMYLTFKNNEEEEVISFAKEKSVGSR